LLEPLGAGGMGIVYKALDRDVADGKRYGPIHIALKIVNEDKQGGPEAIEAIKHEGSVVFKLRHKNIVEMYSAECDGETWFLTMELLEGETFESVIERYPNGVPMEECLPLISQLCAAIRYAYDEQRIIHSDLKPSNVFVTRQKVVKVFDFGIASRVRDIGEPQTRFDPKRWGALTPAYACMEMWSGVSADPRDDIYSLGCIAYQLLCGKHPFDGATAVRVYETGMRVAPIAGLTRRQNAALKHALSLHRDARTPSVEQFQAEFAGRPARTRYALAAGLAACLLLGIVAYFSMPRTARVPAQVPISAAGPVSAPKPSQDPPSKQVQDSAPKPVQDSALRSVQDSPLKPVQDSPSKQVQDSPPKPVQEAALKPVQVPAPAPKSDQAAAASTKADLDLLAIEFSARNVTAEKLLPVVRLAIVAPASLTQINAGPIVPVETGPPLVAKSNPARQTQTPKPLPIPVDGVTLETQISAARTPPSVAATPHPILMPSKKPLSELCKTILDLQQLGEQPNEEQRAYLKKNCL